MAKKILLVDDDPLVIRMYQQKLSGDGYQVFLAYDGQTGYETAKKEKPGLIFLDLMMPKLNGVETLKLLKHDADTKNIPVIILTNLGDRSDDMEKAKAMGAKEYLVKAETDLKTLTAKAKAMLGE